MRIRIHLYSGVRVCRESKEKLVSKFYKHAWPFRRNKTLMFGFMYIEKGLSWYKKAGFSQFSLCCCDKNGIYICKLELRYEEARNVP
jgi:hypothetical protein